MCTTFFLRQSHCEVVGSAANPTFHCYLSDCSNNIENVKCTNNQDWFLLDALAHPFTFYLNSWEHLNSDECHISFAIK